MRTQAMEKLLIAFEGAVLANDPAKLALLRMKSIVLRDRSDKSASVVREIMNGELD